MSALLLAVAAPAGAAEAGDRQFNTQNIQQITDGLAWLALAVCVGGICVSSALWAMGSKGQNPGQELTGKKGIILCLTAAFFVGALPNLIGYLEQAARNTDTAGVTANSGVSPLSYREAVGENGCTESRSIGDLDGPCVNR